MVEHLSLQDLERYRRRKMLPEELLATNDHLATCDMCYERFGGDGQLEAAYKLAREFLKADDEMEHNHLLYEQKVAYLDKKLSERDRKILESHLLLCQKCETEVEDLRTLKRILNFDKEFTPK